MKSKDFKFYALLAIVVITSASCNKGRYPEIESDRGKAYSIDHGLSESIKKNTTDNADWIDKKEGTYYSPDEFLTPKK